MRSMHLFAGAGGGLLADLILGHEPVIAVEWEPYACQVLRERAADGWFPDLQVWEGDVRLFDPSEYKGRVDCIHAGFPCQDISNAGNQAGIGEGTRSNLYREALRIASEIRPEYIFLENVAAITSKSKGYLETISKDLSEIGYDAVWTTLSAAEVGAVHKRNRWWCLAWNEANASCSDTDSERSHRKEVDQHGEAELRNEQECESGSVGGLLGYSNSTSSEGGSIPSRVQQEHSDIECRGSSRNSCEDVADTKRIGQPRQGQHIHSSNQAQDREGKAGDAINERVRSERQAESSLGSLADDVPDHMVRWNDVEAQVGRVTNETQNRADKLKALGNAQVPLQAAVAFELLMRIKESK